MKERDVSRSVVSPTICNVGGGETGASNHPESAVIVEVIAMYRIPQTEIVVVVVNHHTRLGPSILSSEMFGLQETT
jgi:hypothetical protein